MRSRNILKGFMAIIFALLFNTAMGGILAPMVGCSPLSGIITTNALAIVPQAGTWIGLWEGKPNMMGSLCAGLNKEIWLDVVMDKFYPDGSFLLRSKDLSAFVDNDTINLVEAGVDPDVLINNSTYPVATTEQTDTALALVLDTYDTENTVIRHAEEVEHNYDKMRVVVNSHQNALRKKLVQKAAYSWSPQSDSTYTPVLAATGADNGDTLKRLKLADVFKMAEKFNTLDFDTEGRVMVLSPKHLTDLALEDKDLFKVFMNLTEGKITRLFGFDVYVMSQTTRYNKTTGAKVAFGAAAAPSTDTHSSLFFLETEVMRCDGTVDMFSQLKSPAERGDIIGFQKRALALPIRSKAIGAIYSPLFT